MLAWIGGWVLANAAAVLLFATGVLGISAAVGFGVLALAVFTVLLIRRAVQEASGAREWGLARRAAAAQPGAPRRMRHGPVVRQHGRRVLPMAAQR